MWALWLDPQAGCCTHLCEEWAPAVTCQQEGVLDNAGGPLLTPGISRGTITCSSLLDKVSYAVIPTPRAKVS